MEQGYFFSSATHFSESVATAKTLWLLLGGTGGFTTGQAAPGR